MNHYLNLPLELIDLSHNYLNIVEKSLMKRVSKYHQNDASLNIEKEITDKILWITERYPKIVIRMMGGYLKMLTFPILPWQQRFQGSTGYIDGIQPNDLFHSIMLGTDCYERAFIVIKTNFENSAGNTFIKLDVLFQRFSDNPLSWSMACGDNGGCLQKEGGLCIRNGVLQHTLLEKNISNLLHDKGFLVNFKHQSCYDDTTIQLKRYFLEK